MSPSEETEFELLIFEQVIGSLNSKPLGPKPKKPHLLIGNGFSISWDYAAFSYGSLMEKADFGAMSCDGVSLFAAVDTTDFEVVLRHLISADTVARFYDPDSEVATRARHDADVLRGILAAALARNHPATTGDVSEQQYASVRTFLSRFECIYSLNYDLLLYWATLHEDAVENVPRGDGFSNDPDDAEAPWVTWDMANPAPKIHYLHGALHLFDAGDRLKKLTWKRTDIALIEQIRGRLNVGEYPLVVTEGSTEAKLEKIQHNTYLGRALISLSRIGGDLVIYGHSLAENDRHILNAIVRSNVQRLWISLYGDPASEENLALRARAEALVAQRVARNEEVVGRKKRYDLQVQFYDAETVSVWGGADTSPHGDA